MKPILFPQSRYCPFWRVLLFTSYQVQVLCSTNLASETCLEAIISVTRSFYLLSSFPRWIEAFKKAARVFTRIFALPYFWNVSTCVRRYTHIKKQKGAYNINITVIPQAITKICIVIKTMFQKLKTFEILHLVFQALGESHFCEYLTTLAFQFHGNMAT